jgi:hypothetical protein
MYLKTPNEVTRAHRPSRITIGTQRMLATLSQVVNVTKFLSPILTYFWHKMVILLINNVIVIFNPKMLRDKTVTIYAIFWAKILPISL